MPRGRGDERAAAPPCGRARGEAVGVERLAADLRQWTEEMGELGRHLVCANHSAVDHCLELLELVEGLGVALRRARADRRDRQARPLEWNQSIGLRSAVARTDAERARVMALEEEVAALRPEIGRLRNALGVPVR